MRISKPEVIKGKTYTLMQCGAVQGSKGALRLAKIIGPAWAEFSATGSVEKG
jgi:hypothetical protein